jgi:hypothetical protein
MSMSREDALKIVNCAYDVLCANASDINEHLPTLYTYALECDSVFETGVRGVVSSCAFLKGLTEGECSGRERVRKRLFLNDLYECDTCLFEKVAQGLGNVEVVTKWCNNLDICFDEAERYDMTFIDTWHVYGQLKRELRKFSEVTNKYIVMHDTTVDELHGESLRMNMDILRQSQTSGVPIDEITKGLQPAIDEFLYEHPEWRVKCKYTNNNGLTILERMDAPSVDK